MSETALTGDATADRFRFGENWARFVANLDDAAITEAIQSMKAMTGLADLRGKRFLDIGCGSGLFSLAAYKLGADVSSFDFDSDSVACAELLRGRFGESGASWHVTQGSVLDKALMTRLGRHDIVYSWGVLHHTGAMWEAIANAAEATAEGGLFCIAIYNDQGGMSKAWRAIKRLYNQLPTILRIPYAVAIIAPLELVIASVYLLRLDPLGYVRTWTAYGKRSGRGMNKWRDWVDWIGGYPFEVAKPEDILNAVQPGGFELIRMKTFLGRWGCNEFVFRRKAAPLLPTSS